MYCRTPSSRSPGIAGWGRDNYGQSTPPGGNDFVAIVAGGSHGLALKKVSKPGDLNFDGQINFVDFTILYDNWLHWWPFADIAPQPAGDQWVDRMDLALLAQDWLYGATP